MSAGLTTENTGPEHRDECRQTADEARTTARQAREMVHIFNR